MEVALVVLGQNNNNNDDDGEDAGDPVHASVMLLLTFPLSITTDTTMFLRPCTMSPKRNT